MAQMKKSVVIADVVVLVGLPVVLFALWHYRRAPAVRATLKVSPVPPAKSESVQASACPNLAGEYSIQGQDGIGYYTVRQTGCERVEIDRKGDYFGETHTEPTHAFIPDGKDHGDTVPISRWAGGRLQIGEAYAHVYYSVDSSGNLHMSDGRTYPQCAGPCDDVAQKDQ
jgi:hypothetical protein